jgi:hypothetical protein
VAVGDRGGEIDQLAVVRARMLAQHFKGARIVDAVAFHQDALGPLDRRATPERAL